MHQSSLEHMELFVKKYLSNRKNEQLRILDIGSYDIYGTYKPFFQNPSWQYFGLDVAPGPNVDIVLKDPYHWKEIKSKSADVVISGQAFEHIEYFWVTILEVARVLKTDGICCIIAPSGGYEHKYPLDCWRFYPDGFTALAKYARLQPLEVYAQWIPNPKYTDDSNKWQDAVLICQKPKQNLYRQLRAEIRRFLLRILSRNI